MQEQTNPLGLSPRFICIVCGKSYIWNPLWNGNGECDCGSTLIFHKKDSEILTPNKLLLVTGGTGSGKNWIVKNLEGFFKNVPSVTDRIMREGEIPGVDYKFLTTDGFKEIEELGFLIESVKFGENFYGVESQELLDKLYNEKTGGILIVEPGGLMQVLLWLIKHNKCIGGLEIDQVFLDISRTERYNNIVSEYKQLNLSLDGVQESALARLVRNGDSIPADYKKAEGKISEAIDELRSCGITVTRKNITSKSEMHEYVDSYKSTEIDKLLDGLVTKNLELNLSFEELFDKLSDKISKISTISTKDKNV